jgi:predicted 3-demethylubiquinone-9 3-methyltransferase (glyoxalase superfamily)
MKKISPCLWFDTQAEEAVKLYLSIFKNGKILDEMRYDEASAAVSGQPVGSLLLVNFELFGQTYTAMNGGPLFKFTEAVSFSVDCEDQAEVDAYWNALIADGGQESQCGWLKDKVGLSWQLTPKRLNELMADSDPAKASRVMKAMLGMQKLDIAELERAADGK